MRVHIGDGVRLFVDIDGFGLVPDDDFAKLRDRPTVIAMHGGPASTTSDRSLRWVRCETSPS